MLEEVFCFVNLIDYFIIIIIIFETEHFCIPEYFLFIFIYEGFLFIIYKCNKNKIVKLHITLIKVLTIQKIIFI